MGIVGGVQRLLCGGAFVLVWIVGGDNSKI